MTADSSTSGSSGVAVPGGLDSTVASYAAAQQKITQAQMEMSKITAEESAKQAASRGVGDSGRSVRA
jgi:hypothetical protein